MQRRNETFSVIFKRYVSSFLLLMSIIIEYPLFSKVGGSTGSQGKFEKTATLMRHHHNNYKRHNLAIILDPFSPTSTSVGAANNAMGVNTANFMDDQEEQPIFVPHHEKVSNL